MSYDHSHQRIELITRSERRRRGSIEEKRGAIGRDSLSIGKTMFAGHFLLPPPRPP